MTQHPLSIAHLVALFTVAMNMAAVAGESATPLSSIDEDFAWFNSLGFPDVKGRPFVRVATGRWSRTEDQPPQNTYLDAFLLDTHGDEFTVLTFDLLQNKFKKTGPDTPDHMRVDYSLSTLKDRAETLLRSLHSRSQRDSFWPSGPLSKRAEVFIFAWACWRQGLDAEAHQLYSEAARLVSTVVENPNMDLREKLERDLGYAMMSQAMIEFGDPTISRSQLITRFRLIDKNYPRSEYHARAKDTTALLEQMIAEDQTNAMKAVKDLDQFPVEERVRELIFQLRDQNGHQWRQPGYCDVFAVGQGTDSAAHQLVRIGYHAVPQLISALGDRRLTRSVGLHLTVLTVGDCALAILQRISGHRFYEPQSTSGYMSNEGMVEQTQRKVEAWWTEFQKKGEKQALIDGTATGDDDAPKQGEMLKVRFPDAALDALIRGAKVSKRWTRTRLVQLIAGFDDPGGLEFLNDELHNSPDESARAEAAKGLYSHGKTEALQAMINQWSATGAEPIISFLARCDAPEAVAALGESLTSRRVRVRFDVIEQLAGATHADFYGSDRVKKLSPATIDAIEKVLIQALSDIEEYFGGSGSLYGKNMINPRVCDMAGLCLAHCWPSRYTFDPTASFGVQERQRIECQNLWRSAHGLPLLNVPQPRAACVAASQSTIVTAIEWAPDSANPSTEFATAVAALTNKPLEVDEFIHILTTYADAPVSGSAGLELSAIKDEDLTGVLIRVRLYPGKVPAARHDCMTSERVTVGRKCPLLSGGNSSFAFRGESKSWDNLARAMPQAIAASPETPFIVTAGVVSKEVAERR